LRAAADGQNDVWPGFLRLWDAATGRALETVEIDDEGLASVVFSPDGQRLAWGSWNRLSVRDLASHREVLSFHVGQDPSGPVFSRDGRRIAAGSRYFSGTCMVWDAVTGEEIDKLKSDAEWIQVLAFSPDGRRIATHSGMIGGAGELKIREVLRHQEVFSLRLPGGMGTSVAVSPDLRQVAAAWGRTVRIWDATGDPEVVVCGGRGSINGVAFTEDDRRLVGAGGDDAVRVWDTASGQELRMFGQATEGSTMDTRVESVALGPRGEWLAAARGSDVVLWDLRSGDTLFTLKGRVSRSGSD
jgi:WD40 repeat protein